MVSGRVRIVVDAYDQVDGNVARRRLGVFRLGYQVLRADGTPAPGFETPRITIDFTRLPQDARAPALVYAPGSGIPVYGTRRTRFLYTVTNTVRDGIAEEGAWDTTTLEPGRYTLRIYAADSAGNEARSPGPGGRRHALGRSEVLCVRTESALGRVRCTAAAAGVALAASRRQPPREPYFPFTGLPVRRCTVRASSIGSNGFGHVQLEAGAHRLRAVAGGGVGGDGHGRNEAAAVGGQRADAADERVAVLAAHADVAQEHVRTNLRQQREGLRRRVRGRHVGAVVPERGREQLARVTVVVHDHHAHAREVGRSGGRRAAR